MAPDSTALEFEVVGTRLPEAGIDFLMIEFPSMKKVKEPGQQRMSLEEYIRYCDFCIRNNPHITPENCMDRKTGEEDIREPFTL